MICVWNDGGEEGGKEGGGKRGEEGEKGGRRGGTTVRNEHNTHSGGGSTHSMHNAPT